MVGRVPWFVELMIGVYLGEVVVVAVEGRTRTRSATPDWRIFCRFAMGYFCCYCMSSRYV